MSGLLTKVRSLPGQFPLLRGMVSYAIIWPTCSVVQEYIANGTTYENADWARAARYGIFGTFFMAPVFYGWMKFTSRFFKRKNLLTAMTRAAIEQVSYSPLAMAYFFFGMSALELKPLKTCVNEVREKFWPTYKIGVVFWPTAQTINFYFVSERNRIVFVSAASFVWTVYLAHVKAREQKNDVSAASILPEFTKKGVSGADLAEIQFSALESTNIENSEAEEAVPTIFPVQEPTKPDVSVTKIKAALDSDIVIDPSSPTNIESNISKVIVETEFAELNKAVLTNVDSDVSDKKVINMDSLPPEDNKIALTDMAPVVSTSLPELESTELPTIEIKDSEETKNTDKI